MIKKLNINSKRHYKYQLLLEVYQVHLKVIIEIPLKILNNLKDSKKSQLEKPKKNNKKRKTMVLIKIDSIFFFILIFTGKFIDLINNITNSFDS